MKLLTSFLIFIISNVAFAGGSGGGVGPRPSMGVFSFAAGDRQGGGGWMSTNALSTVEGRIQNFNSAAGVDGTSGGGGGTRPGMNYFSTGGGGIVRQDARGFRVNTPVDFVKAMGFDSSGKIQFQYKGFDKNQVEAHTANIQDVSEKYLEALKISQESQQWEPIDIEGLEN